MSMIGMPARLPILGHRPVEPLTPAQNEAAARLAALGFLRGLRRVRVLRVDGRVVHVFAEGRSGA